MSHIPSKAMPHAKAAEPDVEPAASGFSRLGLLAVGGGAAIATFFATRLLRPAPAKPKRKKR